jgi:hypothetical protein
MAAIETIKDHMVSLGFSVDKASYADTTKATANLESLLTKFATHAVTEFGKAALAVFGLEKAIKSVHFPRVPNESGKIAPEGSDKSGVAPPTAPLKNFAQKSILYFGEAAAAAGAFAVAIASITADTLGGLGRQEIKMEMLARSMWTTQSQAMAFSLTLKALGANLQDLYLSPTLMAQYEKLHAVALQMQTPTDYNKQISSIQNISLGFEQMQLEANYSLQWIGYYLTKYMSGPISQVNALLNRVNASIVKGMPNWTKQVAAVMASFMQAGVYIGQALEGTYNWLVKMGGYIPGWAKGIAAALAVLTLAMDANPFGAFMLALAGAILLFDDFETYLRHGKSAFSPFWASISKTGGLLDQLRQTLNTTIKNIGKVISSHKQLFTNLKAIAQDFFGSFGTGANSLTKSLEDVATQGLPKLLNGILNVAQAITGAVHWMDKFGLTKAILAGVLTAFMAFKAVALVLRGVAIAQGLINLAMSANPISLIIIAIAGLVTLLALVIEHWKSITTWATNAWGAIVNGAEQVWTWFTHLGVAAQTLVALIMPLVGIPALIIARWGTIQSFFAGLWTGMKTGFVDAINWIVSGFDKLIQLMNNIPGVNIPLIPLMQLGQTVSSGANVALPSGVSTSNIHHYNITMHNSISGVSDPVKAAAAVKTTFNRNLYNLRGVMG